MDMREFISEEYNIFCSGKLYFEAMYPDSFEFLYKSNMLQVTREDYISAVEEVRAYRQQVLRKFFLNQDAVRETSIVPVTREDKQREEKKIRRLLVKQLLVFKYYDRRKKEGVTNLFLELSEVI